MAEKKGYRVSQIEGRITWQVEELWEGGQVRGPYGSKDAAVNAVKKAAEEGGYTDDLVLTEAVENKVDPAQAFKKNEDGSWECILACAIDIENKEIAFTPGHSYTKGIPFGGVDVAEWLDAHINQ
jgi:hypothetical protein